MKRFVAGAAMVLSLALATAVAAAPAKLTPASKQSGFKKGLSVSYAYAGPPPAKIQTLSAAKSMLSSGAKPGKPLRGLDYRDTNDGDPVLTYPKPYNVAADIRGYIKFDSPGIYQIEVWSNDGVDARISGQRVGYFSTRQGCQGNVIMEVDVPQAGWYPLQVSYFQKYSTSCLMMRWAKNGQKLSWVPNSAFGR